jgi:prepilin-type N-terminal cleavage/methylation domain-containing protein
MNLFRNFKKINNGFTLIELLVVIAIISLLSSIIISSLNSARMKARDTRRIQDLRQIKLALEMYKNDKDYYPSSISVCDDQPFDWCISTNSVNWGKLQDVLKEYIPKLAVDPINIATFNNGQPNNSETNYSYAYRSWGGGKCASGECYDLIANLEDNSSPYRNSIKNYRIYYLVSANNWMDLASNPAQYVLQLYSPQP